MMSEGVLSYKYLLAVFVSQNKIQAREAKKLSKYKIIVVI